MNYPRSVSACAASEAGMAIPSTACSVRASSAPRGWSSLSGLVADEIGDHLQDVELLLSQTLTSRYPAVQELANRAAAMGGKRLRPVLVLLFSRMALGAGRPLSATEASDARRTAVAVELVHAASLVHDDVMDSATQRRHQPTISHVSGNSQAVLLGDFLFTRAYAVAAQCSRSLVARHLADAATQLCEGELRQQASAGDWRLSYREYRSILNQKTGALIGTSCRLGCGVVGANAAVQSAAAKFGVSLGLAFQIYDDWLDYFGEGTRVGKTLGTDLSQFKPTLPLMRLLRTSDRQERRRLIGLMNACLSGSENLDTAQVEIRRALQRSDAQIFTLAAAKGCVEHAKQQLRLFQDSRSLECIRAIADFSVQRSD